MEETVEETREDMECASVGERLEEATRRLEWLTREGLHGNVLAEWREDPKRYLYYGDVTATPFGRGPVLYWVSNVPEYAKAVSDFEEKSDATVYHCILSHTELGDMLAMLYVPAQRSEWPMDWDDLEEGYPVANVVNLADSALSDIGSIGIAVEPMFGGLVRTC